ncbi:MAG: SusC/RagA family TonB-linked outer membrane protein [Muribaculum sp.]|nr:SusC/RagA family TonB-linked outer membrane protein [Muribaculum sp.]
MKKLFLILTAVVAMTVSAFAAQTVTGVVVSADDGEPLMGATVMGVGATDGTVTDVDGRFTFSVPDNVKKLKVSYVGMETKEVNITPGEMRIELSGTNVLDEVIAVAFGTAKKSAFTGSASVMSSAELAKHVTTNVADALVGTVPGLQMRGSSGAPGASQGSMNIRGIASMEASTDPLIIVDGSPYPASLSNIPQQDIESITVLKDAASAALYGARGAAGVIIITTKKGNTKEARITFDAKWGANTRAVQRYDVIDNAGEFYEAYYAQLNNYYLSQGYNPAMANVNANNAMLNQLVYNVYNVPTGQNLIGINGKLNPNATLGNRVVRNGVEYYLTPDDWTDLAYRTGFRQEYNVNVNGGNDKANYYASLGYLDEEGIINFSGYERLTARFKGDFQAKKWLKLGVNVGYVHSKTTQTTGLDDTSGSGNMMYYTDYIAPIYPAYVRVVGADGRPEIAIDEYGHQRYDYGTPASYGYNRPFGATGNPLGANKYNKTLQIGDQLNGTFTADFTFTDYLKANITSNVVWGETQHSLYENPYEGPKASQNGALTKYTQTSLRTNNVQSLTYFNQFGLHNVNVLVGHEYYKEDIRYLSASATNGFSPEIPELNAFANKTTSASYQQVYNVEGYFGRAQYDYDSKYFASVSYRRDASSRFAKDKRWGNFWSVGGAWIINKDFFTDKEWIKMLKLKASVGQQGNDNIINWAYIDTYTLVAGANGMSTAFRLLGNPNITWETSTNWNAGVEFGFFNNRLNGTIDAYYKKTTDLLFWLNIPESAGSRGFYDNIGDIRNAGVEVTLNGGIIRSKLINLDVNLNFTHNSNKILKLPQSKKEYGGFSDNENQVGIWYQEGKSLYNAYLPAYAGVNEKGQAIYFTDPDVDMEWTQTSPAVLKDPNSVTTDINLAPNYECGNMLPTLYGGFGVSLTVQNFDASAQFDYQLGGKVYDSQYAHYMTPTANQSSAGSTFHRDYVKSWSPENPNSNIPRWQYRDQYTSAKSDRFLTSARYLNFQSFTVGYTLPKFWKEISNIRVYVMGENLCFWSARKGLDPRYAYSGINAVNGISTYQTSRNISGGIQVTF